MQIKISVVVRWTLIFTALLHHTTAVAQKFAIYDASTQFTSAELYMMQDANPSCVNHKHFLATNNPPWVPVLADAFATNSRCYEMYFPACQWSHAVNFEKKCMSQPANQREFPLGSDVWQAFSILVPTNYNNNPLWDLVYQFHDHPDNVGVCDWWTTPSLSLGISNGNWIADGLYQILKCDKGVWPTPAFETTNAMTKGCWSHFVVHVRFDYRGGGRCEVWLKDSRNPTPVKFVDYSGPLGHNDEH